MANAKYNYTWLECIVEAGGAALFQTTNNDCNNFIQPDTTANHTAFCYAWRSFILPGERDAVMGSTAHAISHLPNDRVFSLSKKDT